MYTKNECVVEENVTYLCRWHELKNTDNQRLSFVKLIAIITRAKAIKAGEYGAVDIMTIHFNGRGGVTKNMTNLDEEEWGCHIK